MKHYFFILILSFSASNECKSQDVYSEVNLKWHEGLFKLANDYMNNGADTVFGYEYVKTYISFPNSDSKSYVVDKGYYFIVKANGEIFTERIIHYDNGKIIKEKAGISSGTDSLEITDVLYTKDKGNFIPAVLLSNDSSNHKYYYVILNNDLHVPSQAILFRSKQMELFNYILISSISASYLNYENLNYDFNIRKPMFRVFKYFYKKCLGLDFNENQF